MMMMNNHLRRRNSNGKDNLNIIINPTMSLSGRTAPPTTVNTSEKKQTKAILDKLELLSSDPPLFFVYCNDVDIMNNFASAITTILTLTPRALNASAHIDNPTHVLLALSNASALLASIIDTLISVYNSSSSGRRSRRTTNNSAASTGTVATTRSNSNNINMVSRTVGRAIRRKRLTLPEWPNLAQVIQREADAIIDHVDRAKDLMETTSNSLYNKMVAAGCYEEENHECSSPQSVQLALIAHTHQLIDALLAFNGNTTEGEWIAHSTNNADAPHRQHQVVNGQLNIGAIRNMTYRSSADLSRSSNYQQQYQDNNRALKRKSAETAGSRFMRGISSSFRTTTSSSMKIVSSDQETTPRSSKSSTVSFPDHRTSSSIIINDEDDMRIRKTDENASTISMQSVSHHSTTSYSSASSPKNAIRTFFGSATTIVRHGRDHQISPSSKTTAAAAASKQQQRNNSASNSSSSTSSSSNGHNHHHSMHTMTWRQMFMPGLMRKSPKYEGSFLDEDSSSSSTSSYNNRRSFTSDHMAETVKLYSSQERQRWSCGDDTKYSPSEIAKYNSMYRINSRKLGERKCERHSATMRFSNGSDYQELLHPTISTIFNKESSDTALSTTTRSESYSSSDNMHSDRDTSRHQQQDVDHFSCGEPAIYRRSLYDDDDELEMLTMGTYGPLTPISVLESPTTQSSPTATNNGDGPAPAGNASPRSTSSQKEDSNLDRISTRSSSYFSARSFSSYSSLHSAKSNSQPRSLDLEMARYHYTNGDDTRRHSSIIVTVPLSLSSPTTDDNNQQHTAVDDEAIEPTTIAEIRTETKNTTAVDNKYATISSSSVSTKQQSSTLLSKAMMFAEGRLSSEEQQQQAVSASSSYRSVGTIGISTLSSVLARHWAPHRRTASIQGNKSQQIKSAQQQRRSPIPFSTSDPDMGNNSDSAIQPVNAASGDTSCRSLDIENRVDFTKLNDELNHVCENGHIVLITQPVAGDKQKVIAGTGAQLFKKLIESAIHDLDYIDTYLLSHHAFISSAKLFDHLKDVFQGTTWHEYGMTSQRSIQLRVINVMTRWIKLQYEDFKADGTLLHRLHQFLLKNMRTAQIAEELATIRNLLEIQQERSSSDIVYSSLPRVTSSESLERARPHAREFYPFQAPAAAAPTTIPSSPPAFSTATVSPSLTFKKGGVNALALSSTSSALASLDAQDVAQYLTLADFNVFKNISPHEYLRGTWRSSSVDNSQQQHELFNPKKSGYARILTRRANMLSHWVLHEVCSPQHPKQRRMIIRKLIHIAKLCIEWNNFHTGMIIIMGLQCPTIQRLENTWQALPSRDMNAFDALQKYVDVTNNMRYYRQALATAKAPVVPFFPLILKDLTFFMDGNPTMATPPSPLPEQQHDQQPSPSTKLINFDKFRVLTHFVNTLMRYTTENYWFASDLEHCPFLPHISITRPCCSSQFPADVPILDRVAELVEIKIRSVESCYEDSRCSTQWVSSNMRRVGKQQLS